MNDKKQFDLYGQNLIELNSSLIQAGGIGLLPGHLQMTVQDFLVMISRNHISLSANHRDE